MIVTRDDEHHVRERARAHFQTYSRCSSLLAIMMPIYK